MADTLYLSSRREAAARGVEDEFGILWRYDAAGSVIGMTIVDFWEAWAARQPDLAERVATGFHIPKMAALEVVQGVRHGR